MSCNNRHGCIRIKKGFIGGFQGLAQLNLIRNTTKSDNTYRAITTLSVFRREGKKRTLSYRQAHVGGEARTLDLWITLT